MSGDPECVTDWIPLHDCSTSYVLCRDWPALTDSALLNKRSRVSTFRDSPRNLD
jgi:hypothetical protein